MICSLTKITRVKKRRKQAKTTVEITISPILLAETRKHNLNINRITEQALNSILDYLHTQNETKSSKYFLSRVSFSKGNRAGSLARLGHLLDVQKVAGSNPVRPTQTPRKPLFIALFTELGCKDCVNSCFKLLSKVLERLKPNSRVFSINSLSRSNTTFLC